MTRQRNLCNSINDTNFKHVLVIDFPCFYLPLSGEMNLCNPQSRTIVQFVLRII